MQTALSEKWTHGPGGGYTPSSIYSGNGDEHGVFETILGAGGDGVEGAMSVRSEATIYASEDRVQIKLY